MKTATLATAAALALATAFGGPALAEGMKSTQAGAETSAGTQASAGAAAGLSGENLDSTEVRAIQQALKDAGHDVTVDGQWGDNTAQAVLDYQQANGLQGSGELDPRTIAALGVDLEAAGGMQTQQAQTPDSKPTTGDSDAPGMGSGSGMGSETGAGSDTGATSAD